MSPRFIPAVGEQFENATITVDWFHVVKLFTSALDEVRRTERKQDGFPKDARWATLKGEEQAKTEAQERALRELEASGFATATAYRIKEAIRRKISKKGAEQRKMFLIPFHSLYWDGNGCSVSFFQLLATSLIHGS
jgi:transposase